ncbi:MAG: hypothetical protein K0V04_13865 [Deltaproteobacteria bacterium]|nr:hypothetical protein [Deltaproteobacteria bacterium]
MPDHRHKEDSGDFALAPPPSFGVAERTDGHLLPVATGMGDIFEDDSVNPDVVEPAWPPPADVPVSTKSKTVSASSPRVAPEPEPEPKRSYVPLVLLFVLLLGVGAGAWLWMQEPDDAGAVAQADADTPAPSTAAAGTVPKPEAVTPPAEGDANETNEAAEGEPEPDERVAKVNDIALMKRTDLLDRHALLGELETAGLTAQVNLELHVALDLMQAGQADSPCEVFSDSLTLIERNRERAEFRPAIASVDGAPRPGPGETDADCEGLDARLAALKAGPDAGTPVEAAPAAKPTRKKSRKNPKARKTKPANPPPPSTDSPPSAEPKPKPASSPDVATKLDDGLREID